MATLSPSNPRVKSLRRLIAQRKARSSERAFVAEGPVLVAEALTTVPDLVREVFADEAAWADFGEVADAAGAAGVAVDLLPPGVLGSMLDTMSPQPVVAVVDDAPIAVDDLPAGRPALVLHDLRDPGNVGTLLRTAEAAGFGGVVVTGESVDVSNPKVVRAAAGARLRVAVAVERDEHAAFDALRATGHRVLATVVDSTGGATDYESADLTTAAIVLGNEAHGLDAVTVAAADESITIPLAGPTESLNVAAAGAVVCFASWNQRRRQFTREPASHS